MIINQKIKPITNFSKATVVKRIYKIFDFLYATGLFVFLVFAFIYSSDKFLDFPVEYILSFANGILSIFGQILSIKKNASIHFISFIFSYLFMSVTPIVQLGLGHDPIFNIDNIALQAIATALIFTFIGLIFIIKVKTTDHDDDSHKKVNGNYLFLFVLTFLVGSSAIILFWNGLFTSRYGFGVALRNVFSNGPTALLSITFLMSVPAYGAAIGLRASFENRRYVWTCLYLILLFMAAVINNPLINPRFKLAGLLFFFVDYLFSGKRLRLLVIIILIGIAVAPLFHVFRRENPSVTVIHNKAPFSDSFLSYDYDAFQLSCYTILTVKQNGITWGANIAGALLGFIPRSLWEGKPERTSAIIYNTMIKHREVGTDNLSTPLMAEGYFAFSWAGVLLISLFYWSFISKLFVSSLKNANALSFLFRCIFAGLVLILLRGTLIVAVPAVFGAFIAAYIPWFVFWFGKLQINKTNNYCLNKPVISSS